MSQPVYLDHNATTPVAPAVLEAMLPFFAQQHGSIMLANNETGALQDVVTLAATAASSGAWFHTDAVQALGKVPVDFRSLNTAGVHAMTVSAHKLGGPKGAGALVVDKRVDLAPLIDGETLVARLDRAGFAVASGAACSAANPEPSHVLLAMGVAPETARGAVRVSLGQQNTADDVAGFLRALAATLSQLKSLTAVHHTAGD